MHPHQNRKDRDRSDHSITTPGVHSDSRPSSQWCHPTISSSVVPFSSSVQSCPASESFPMSRLFKSAQVSELQLQHQSLQCVFRVDFLEDWLVWSPCMLRDSQKSSPTPQFENISSSAPSLLMVQLSHPYMITGKTITLTRWTFVGKVMSLLFNMLSRLIVTFLLRSKRLLISRLQL